jgi:hypothetical protein
MPRFITAGIVILYLLPLFYPSGAMAFAVAATGASQNAAPSKTTTDKASKKASSTKSASNAATQKALQRNVVNIVVDKIEGGTIYSKGGGKFRISGSTKVIDNRHSVTKMRIAELVFEDGTLVAVSIK